MYELRKGEKLNKYQIIDLLGRGAMGEVYKARDPDTGVVAIKVLREDLGKEIAPRKMPSHKNIVIIYAVERTPRDTKFIVMEYYSGHDLKKYSSRMRSQLAREQYYLEMCQIVAQCCEGLEHAHQHGIIHRDIKPANIFILDTPRRSTDWVKILDFGIAKITGGTTTAHGQVGTLPYMSPEHLISSVDSFSDQFSLGIVFYELLAGRRPFNATDSRDLQRQIVNEPAPPLIDICPSVPETLAGIVMQMLEKDPRDRYPDMESLAGKLYRLIDTGIHSTGTQPVDFPHWLEMENTVVQRMQDQDLSGAEESLAVLEQSGCPTPIIRQHRASIQRVKQEREKNTVKKLESFKRAAQSEVRRGNIPEAIRYYQKAVELGTALKLPTSDAQEALELLVQQEPLSLEAVQFHIASGELGRAKTEVEALRQRGFPPMELEKLEHSLARIDSLQKQLDSFILALDLAKGSQCAEEISSLSSGAIRNFMLSEQNFLLIKLSEFAAASRFTDIVSWVTMLKKYSAISGNLVRLVQFAESGMKCQDSIQGSNLGIAQELLVSLSKSYPEHHAAIKALRDNFQNALITTMKGLREAVSRAEKPEDIKILKEKAQKLPERELDLISSFVRLRSTRLEIEKLINAEAYNEAVQKAEEAYRDLGDPQFRILRDQAATGLELKTHLQEVVSKADSGDFTGALDLMLSREESFRHFPNWAQTLGNIRNRVRSHFEKLVTVAERERNYEEALGNLLLLQQYSPTDQDLPGRIERDQFQLNLNRHLTEIRLLLQTGTPREALDLLRANRTAFSQDSVWISTLAEIEWKFRDDEENKITEARKQGNHVEILRHRQLLCSYFPDDDGLRMKLMEAGRQYETTTVLFDEPTKKAPVDARRRFIQQIKTKAGYFLRNHPREISIGGIMILLIFLIGGISAGVKLRSLNEQLDAQHQRYMTQIKRIENWIGTMEKMRINAAISGKIDRLLPDAEELIAQLKKSASSNLSQRQYLSFFNSLFTTLSSQDPNETKQYETVVAGLLKVANEAKSEINTRINNFRTEVERSTGSSKGKAIHESFDNAESEYTKDNLIASQAHLTELTKLLKNTRTKRTSETGRLSSAKATAEIPETAKNAIGSGDSFYTLGLYENALERYKSAISQIPPEAVAGLSSAKNGSVIQENNGKLKEACDELRKVFANMRK